MNDYSRMLSALAAGIALALAWATLAHADTRVVYVRNVSDTISDRLLAEELPAFQASADDVASVWPGTSVRLRLIGAADAPDDGWTVTVEDAAACLFCLGYHDVAGDTPFARVFAGEAVDDGYSWTVTFTHELAEMQVDPLIDRAAWDGLGHLRLVEVGDPVEADRFAYWRRDALGRPVSVSDFVTENWYRAGSVGPYDFARRVKRPLQLLKGGYVSIWNGVGWRQETR